MDLRNNLIKQFGVELPATVIFDYPSTEALVRFITAELPQADAAMYSEPEDLRSPALAAPQVAVPQIDSSAIR